MKNFILLFTTLLVFKASFGQTMVASIGVGATARNIKIYLKPDVTQTPATFSTLQFNVSVPATIVPAPTLALVSQAFAGVTWIIDPPYLDNGFWNYNIYNAAAGYTLNILANTEFEAMELAFSGGPNGTFANTAHLLCQPDGGLGGAGNAYYFCSGTIFSNGSNLFYARDANVFVQGGMSYLVAGVQSVISYARLISGLLLGSGATSSATDYFRSITSGNWNAPATWESSSVSNFASVVSPATLSPDVNSNDINIRTGHTVTVTANVTTDQTFVNPGATLVVTGSTLTVSSNGLTMQSDATGTGRIGNSTGTISGNVNVERYIAAAGHRAWHLLSGKSVGGAQTIFNAWQEGGVNVAGKGTWVTSTLFTGANGFDATNQNLSSIITHVQGGAAGPSWNYTLANTNTTLLNAFQGYMLFVRGDRSYTPTLPTPTAFSATTLRTNGTLNQGLQSAVTVSSTGTGYTLVGNPFVSAIDFETFFGTANLYQFFYIWDPTMTGNFGVGGFRLVQRTGALTYVATPTTGSDNTLRYFPSGGAFLLKATGADASLALNEVNKAIGTSVVNPIINGDRDQQITANLMIMHPGTYPSLADGIRVRFNDAYNANTSDDIIKIGNFAENIASYRDGQKWIVEKRPMIVSTDTIFLRITNSEVRDYRISLNALNFMQTGLPAVLEDIFLNTKTNIDLQGGTTNYDFSVTSDPASANPDRFSIVFGAKKADVPLVTTGVKGISIYPNPVSNRMVTVQFTDMEQGIYLLRLISNSGQVVMSQQVNHGGGTGSQKMGLNKQIANGNYRLEIIKPDNSREMKTLVIIDN